MTPEGLVEVDDGATAVLDDSELRVGVLNGFSALEETASRTPCVAPTLPVMVGLACEASSTDAEFLLVLASDRSEIVWEVSIRLVGRIVLEFGSWDPESIEIGQKLNWRKLESQYRSMMNL